MKRFFTISICMILSFVMLIPVFANECNHNYVGELVNADCEHLERTVYTCALCGDIYSINTIDQPIPDKFSIVLSSVRDEDELIVTAKIYNNPGLIAARIMVYFNTNALELVSFKNGQVWPDSAYTGGINPQNDHITVYTETENINSKNTSNGLYFTLTFDVISEEDYGIYTKCSNKDFNDWNTSGGGIVYYSPKIVNLCGKSEFGDHSFSDWSTVTDSTFTEHGIEQRTCLVCGIKETQEKSLLTHWMKGDLNNDSKLNAVDANLMSGIIVRGTDDIFQKDAADMNEDGHVNAVDANLIFKSIVGG